MYASGRFLKLPRSGLALVAEGIKKFLNPGISGNKVGFQSIAAEIDQFQLTVHFLECQLQTTEHMILFAAMLDNGAAFFAVPYPIDGRFHAEVIIRAEYGGKPLT